MELFDKKFVYFMWDEKLEGKVGFVEDSIKELKDMVNAWEKVPTPTYKGRLTFSGSLHLPFSNVSNIINKDIRFRFAYYDPNYECKVAYAEGKTIQISSDNNIWVDWEGEHEPDWKSLWSFRIKSEEYYVHTCGYGYVIDNHNADVTFKGTKKECEEFTKNHMFDLLKKACYIEHKQIQFKSKDTSGEWKDCFGTPLWLDENEYRVKPEELIRPYKDCDELINDYNDDVENDKDVTPEIWIKHKIDGRRILIVEFGKDFVKCGSKSKPVSLDMLLSNYTFLNGSPIGVLEQ